MKVRICPECETQNREGAWHCLNCGKTLTANDVVRSDKKDTAVSSNPEDDIERNSLAFIAGALAGFITPIVISVFFAIYFVFNDFLYYLNHPNLTWTNYRYYLDDLVWPIGPGILLGVIYGVGLALMGLILNNKKKLNTPKDWVKTSGTITFFVLLIPTILGSPILLFGVFSAIVEGREEFVSQLLFLYVGLIGLGAISGFGAGHIYRRLCQRRNL